MAEEKSNLLIRNRNGITLVNVLDVSVLDRTQIDKIGDELLRLVEDLGRKKVLVNFEGVDYLSSAVLGKLIALHKRLAMKSGELKLSGIKASILEVFEITKLDKVFDIYSDEESAVASFGA